MPPFLKPYYDTEGPFGLPMRDAQAQQLDALLKTLPREAPFEPQKSILTKGIAELLPGERADISWISEESMDRQGDIVLAAGMDDAHFQLNPLVTMNHAYWMPPVAKSLWRKRATDGPLIGIKAKTQYHRRPDTWPPDTDWPPDVAFTLVQSGLLRGKSVGFLPTKVRRPSSEETERTPALSRVRFIIEKWILLEYACVYLPAQQHAVVESVSKNIPADVRQALGWNPQTPTPFTPLSEIERALHRRLAALNIPHLFQSALDRGWQKLRGRI
jgi:hypothetical protein